MGPNASTAASTATTVSAAREPHAVFVVDDDHRVRDSLFELLSSLNLTVQLFASAAEYLGSEKPDVPSCLILDVWLPDVDDLAQQAQDGQVHQPPIVFITGHGDIPASVRALKPDALDFLTKPFNLSEIGDAVDSAIARDQCARIARTALSQLRQRYATLTAREREVFPLVISGLLNKQAAAELGISEVTLQIHRSRVMRKMGAESLADLVRMADHLEIPFTSRDGTHDTYSICDGH